MINENHKQVTEKNDMESSNTQTANENKKVVTNEAECITNAKQDIFKRLDKRKEDLEQQRSVHASERTKNTAENEAIHNRVSKNTASFKSLLY